MHPWRTAFMAFVSAVAPYTFHGSMWIDGPPIFACYCLGVYIGIRTGINQP